MTNGTPTLKETPAPAERDPSTWQDDEISILDLLLVLVRHRRLIVYTVLFFTLVGVLYTLTAEPEYTSSAKVIREATEENIGGLGGLSMLQGLGINLGGSSSGLSVDAYSDVLGSREVRRAVVRDTFYFRELNTRMSFIDYATRPGFLETWLGTESDDAEDQQAIRQMKQEERAMNALANVVGTSVDRETGLMTISARTRDPQLSEALVNSLVAHLSERVRQIHTGKAQLNVEFIRARFEEAGRELRRAEEELAHFLDRNNNPQTAQLRTELERYQRNVSFKSQLYSELQTQLTQAELNLQKTQPVITVLEQPVLPTRPDSSALSIPLCIALGLFAGAMLAFARSAFTRAVSSDSERHKFEEIRATVGSLRKPRRFRWNSKVSH